MRSDAIKRRELLSTIMACVVLAAACGDSTSEQTLGDRLAESLVESLRKRAMDRHRGDLPLPGEELFVDIDIGRQQPDEGFRVDLLDHLVIGAEADDPNYMFAHLDFDWSVASVAVDDAGRIFVLSPTTRSTQVRAYDSDGRFLYRFAPWGEGPGDLYFPRTLIVAGDSLLVFHRDSTLLSYWRLDGSFLRQQEAPGPGTRENPARRILAAAGLADGSMVAMYPLSWFQDEKHLLARNRIAAVRFDASGAEARRYFDVPGETAPRIAVSRNGSIYASFSGPDAGQYYVVAWARDGSPRWFTALEPPDGDVRWAELRLDDAGHLYVMPSYRPLATGDPRRPVYVFATEGRFIGSGYLNRSPERLHWQIARSGMVYGARRGPEHEWAVVRYRVEMTSAPTDRR